MTCTAAERTRDMAAGFRDKGCPKCPIPPEDRITALYCRTAEYDDYEIEQQLERLGEFAEDYGYVNTVAYIDNGKSGRTLKRPAMKQLVEDIGSGKIHYVIVTRADRIARDLPAMFKWATLVSDTEVKCISLESFGRQGKSEFAFWSDMLFLIDSV